MAGFCLNGEMFLVVFFSIEQGISLIKRFTVCLSDQLGEVQTAVNDPTYLPQKSTVAPVIISGMAADTLIKRWQAYNSVTPDQHENDIGYDIRKSRLVAYLYPPCIDAGWAGEKSTIIALKDADGSYHVYVTYSDYEAKSVLQKHGKVELDMHRYEEIMRLNPMGQSATPTIHLGGQRGEVSARDLCLFLDVSRLYAAIPETPAMASA